MKLFLIAVLFATSTLALGFSRVPIFTKRPSQKKGPRTLGKTITNMKWTDCDGTGAPYQELLSVSITGSLDTGSTIAVVTKANNKQAFSIYFADVTAWVSGIKVYSGVDPLNPPQSFTPGPSQFSLNYKVPISPPNGNFKVQARIQDKSHKELQCYLFTFTIA